MNEEEFRLILQSARNGELSAIERILELYMPMISKYSYIFGCLDEDLREYIIYKIIKSIKGFEV